jgi:hypothetical protein
MAASPWEPGRLTTDQLIELDVPVSLAQRLSLRKRNTQTRVVRRLLGLPFWPQPTMGLNIRVDRQHIVLSVDPA